MRTYTEEQVISILNHIERNGFNDDCMTMNEELEYLNSTGVVKNCSIPFVSGALPFPVAILDGLKIDVEFKNGGIIIKSNDR